MHAGEIDFIESVKASFFLENSFSNSKKVRNQNHLEVKKVPAFCFWLLVGRLGTRHQIQAFQGFSGNFLIS